MLKKVTINLFFRLEEVISGALVDVRDDEYIWRKGRVIRTFNRINS